MKNQTKRLKTIKLGHYEKFTLQIFFNVKNPTFRIYSYDLPRDVSCSVIHMYIALPIYICIIYKDSL